jgi:hypothetical protein
MQTPKTPVSAPLRRPFDHKDADAAQLMIANALPNLAVEVTALRDLADRLANFYLKSRAHGQHAKFSRLSSVLAEAERGIKEPV